MQAEACIRIPHRSHFKRRYLETTLMHLGISETPTSIGTFKWKCLRMKLESSLRSIKKGFTTTSTSERSICWTTVNWCEGLKKTFELVLKIKIYRTVVLYGCETWSLTLREERKLRVFENTVLRRIFGPRRDEVTGEWRRLHNEELNDLYSSPNIMRVIKSRRMR